MGSSDAPLRQAPVHASPPTPWLPTCRHLGSFINGQRATLADPAAFFGVLHAFAEELEVAHEENAAADATASAGNATAKAAPGRSKVGAGVSSDALALD